MAMDPRQRQKEMLRMKREMELIQASIEKNSQAAGQKESENHQITDLIAEQEKENDRLAVRMQEIEGQVLELDEEFKENQIQATRLRKEARHEENTLKLLKYISTGVRDKEIFDMIVDELPDSDPLKRAVKLEPLEPKMGRCKNQLVDLQNHLKDVRKTREGAEYKLRKTSAKIEEIQKHPASKPVTGKIEKQRKLDAQERQAKGIQEQTMEERLHELDAVKVKSQGDYLHELLEEAGIAALEPSANGKAEAAPVAKAESAGGLDLSF